MIRINKTSDKKYSYQNLLIMGESGCGKTHFLGTADNAKTLVVNVVSESGVMTLADKNIDVTEVNSFDEIMNVLKYLKTEKHTYEFLGIDSVSQLQKNFEKEITGGGNKFEKWKIIKDNTKKMIDGIKLLPMHTCCTSEVAVKDDDESLKYVPSLVGSSKDDFTYWFDIVLYFSKFQSKEGEEVVYRALSNSASKYPCKDRTKKLPMVIENPNWLDISKLTCGSIDSEQQGKDFERLKKKDQEERMAVVNQEIMEESAHPSEQDKKELRGLITKKEFDMDKFLANYGQIPLMTRNQVKEAITLLKKKPFKKDLQESLTL